VLHALGPAARVEGFELHHGRMYGAQQSALRLDDGSDEGSVRGPIIASMLHRLFDQASARDALLDWLRSRRGLPAPIVSADPPPDPYDRLADHLQGALDWPRLRAIALGSPG
jgi:cobyric acid synthase